MFPNLGHYSLEQQTGVIDLLYNYGSGNLRKHGAAVIDAIKSGDWTKAGDAVLGLPTHGTTFAKDNATRAQAIKKSLQTPPAPDPCK
jgi:GH24 family phage-related lysozyme (muramidase)